MFSFHARGRAGDPSVAARAPSITTRARARESKLRGRAIPWVLMCALGACKEAPPASARPRTQEEYSLARPAAGLAPPSSRAADFRRGVTLELFVGEVEGEARRAAYAGWLDQATRLGASDVELVVQWSQLEPAAVEMAPHATHTVDDAFLGWLMDQAASRGLRVLLTPVLALERQGAPGGIAPADHKRWFWSYQRFVSHYARIAQAHGAWCLAVGWDLPALEVDDAHWRELIGQVRKAFKGKLAYGVRADRLSALPFWDALDVVHVVEAGALAREPAPAAEAKLAALAATLRAWRTAHDRPLLATRIVPGGVGAGESAQRGQLDATRALYRALQAEPLVVGVYVKLDEPGATGSPAPLARASGEVLRHWYAGSRSKH